MRPTWATYAMFYLSGMLMGAFIVWLPEIVRTVRRKEQDQ